LFLGRPSLIAALAKKAAYGDTIIGFADSGARGQGGARLAGIEKQPSGEIGMSESREAAHVIPDWDVLYREGTPSWETGRPARELIRALDEGIVKPGTALEVGCGTGADAVYLAKRGFEVTAVDWSPTAVERARTRARLEGAPVRFVLDDVFDFVDSAGTFDLVYDAGFYHYVRQVDLSRYLDLLWRVTRPGSLFLALIGSDKEQAEGGPPRVSRDEIRLELGRAFEFAHLRPCRIDSRDRENGYSGWSCLMKRPQVAP
jgi:SAM-dependent methyltransferase